MDRLIWFVANSGLALLLAKGNQCRGVTKGRLNSPDLEMNFARYFHNPFGTQRHLHQYQDQKSVTGFILIAVPPLSISQTNLIDIKYQLNVSFCPGPRGMVSGIVILRGKC